VFTITNYEEGDKLSVEAERDFRIRKHLFAPVSSASYGMLIHSET